MVRSYRQYAQFEGSIEELNKELMNMQTDQIEVVSVHKLYDDTYEILFHVGISAEDIVNAVQNNPNEEM